MALGVLEVQAGFCDACNVLRVFDYVVKPTCWLIAGFAIALLARTRHDEPFSHFALILRI